MSLFVERPGRNYYSKISTHPDHPARYSFAANVFKESLVENALIGEIGCGTAESTRYLRKLLTVDNPNVNILGVDIDEKSVEIARAKKLPNTTFITADAGAELFLKNLNRQLNTKSLILDDIAFIETLEHISPSSNALIAMQNLKNILKPSTGRMIVSTPNRRVLSNIQNRPFNPYHIQEFNRVELTNLINKAGLSLVELFGQRLIPEEFIKRFDIFRQLAIKLPHLRKHISKIINLSILLKAPNPTVLPLNENHIEPKFFIAVCKKDD